MHNMVSVSLYLDNNIGVKDMAGMLGSRTFRPFDVSPPGRFAPSMDVSPLGRFATWTFRPLTGRFAPDCGRFAPVCFSVFVVF